MLEIRKNIKVEHRNMRYKERERERIKWESDKLSEIIKCRK